KMPRLGKIAVAGLGIVWGIAATVAGVARGATAPWRLGEITLAQPAAYPARLPGALPRALVLDRRPAPESVVTVPLRIPEETLPVARTVDLAVIGGGSGGGARAAAQRARR